MEDIRTKSVEQFLVFLREKGYSDKVCAIFEGKSRKTTEFNIRKLGSAWYLALKLSALFTYCSADNEIDGHSFLLLSEKDIE